jgi:hypothetical protein
MNDTPPKDTGAGKGDAPRKYRGDTFRDNYDDIFRKRDKQEEQQPTNNDNNGKAIQESDHKP